MAVGPTMCPSEVASPGGPGDPGQCDPEAARAGAILTIDLDALADNYRRLCAELNGVPCAAVVKADGYGLGLRRVAPALYRAGARSFFVAQFGEAIALRGALPEAAEIYVLNGLAAGPAAEFQAQRVVPVLNSLAEVADWQAAARRAESALAAALHVDTAMSRLGLPASELDALAAEPGRLEGIELNLVMSHLACADAPEHPLNAAQLAEFRAARARLPAAPASFANSSGIFLGADYPSTWAARGSRSTASIRLPAAPIPCVKWFACKEKSYRCARLTLPGPLAMVRPIAPPGRPESRPSRSVMPTAT